MNIIQNFRGSPKFMQTSKKLLFFRAQQLSEMQLDGQANIRDKKVDGIEKCFFAIFRLTALQVKFGLWTPPNIN